MVNLRGGNVGAIINPRIICDDPVNKRKSLIIGNRGNYLTLF